MKNLKEAIKMEEELGELTTLYKQTVKTYKANDGIISKQEKVSLAGIRKQLVACSDRLVETKNVIISNEVENIASTTTTLLQKTNIDVEAAITIYQNSAINYAQQVEICVLAQIARERLAYDLFLCVADDSGISSNEKVALEKISSELVEMIPKVGEYLEIASEIQSGFIETQLKTSELNVRYGAVKTSIGVIDLDKNKQTNFRTTVEDYVEHLLDRSLIVNGDRNSTEQKQVYTFYIKAAQMINRHTIELRDVSTTIKAYIPNNKAQYVDEMKGLLAKESVAEMFKHYLIEWLNSSGHYVELYCSFTQAGMEYNIDKNAPQRLVIVEPHSGIGEFFGDIVGYEYEDAAVTKALVELGILKYKNAPITKAQLEADGLKIKVNYPLAVEYRTGTH